MKKHAYLIIAYNEFDMLRKLLYELDDVRNDIYIHIDKKTKRVDEEEIRSWVQSSKVYFVPRMDTRWGHVSLVRCELLLLEEARKRQHYHYYHLLSGMDFPLKTQDEIHQYLEKENRQFVTFYKNGEYGDEFMYKIQVYHPFLKWIGQDKGCFSGPGKRNAFFRKLFEIEYKILKQQMDHGVDRTAKYKNIIFYKGSQWFSITDDFAELLVKQKQQIKKMYRLTNGADEFFVPTIAMNSEFHNRIANWNFRRIDWKRGMPYEFVKEDLAELEAADEFFVRKVSFNRQPELVNSLHAHIHKEFKQSGKDFPLISVIIPIYNVEQYLRKCLDSVVKQTYQNLEVIMIDDGSKDHSADIAKEYAQKYSNFIYYRKENGGLSSARNLGIEKCKGEFLVFIDSDDWMDEDYIQTLYMACRETGADMAVCGYQKEELEHDKVTFDQNMVLSRYEAMKLLGDIYPKENVLMVVSWNKLFRKKIFENIRFIEGKIHEDEFIVHRMIHETDVVAVLSETMYHYRIRSDSITGKDRTQDLRHFDLLEAHRDRLLCTRHMLYGDFFILMLYSYYEALIQLMLRYSKETFRENKLNSVFRKAALGTYIEYFKELDGHQKREYLQIIVNPIKYRNKVKKELEQHAEI